MLQKSMTGQNYSQNFCIFNHNSYFCKELTLCYIYFKNKDILIILFIL